MWVNHTGPLYVILSAAKDLCGRLARSFAALRMTAIISKCLSAIPEDCKLLQNNLYYSQTCQFHRYYQERHLWNVY